MPKTLRGGNSSSRVTKRKRQEARYEERELWFTNKSTLREIADDLDCVPTEGELKSGKPSKEQLVKAILQAQRTSPTLT